MERMMEVIFIRLRSRGSRTDLKSEFADFTFSGIDVDL